MLEESRHLNISQLQDISNFLFQRANEIRLRINGLSINSLNDADFENTLQSFVREFAINEVSISQPEVGERITSVSPHIVQVFCSVSGDINLFRFKSDSAFGIDSFGIFQPNSNNIIVLNLPEVNDVIQEFNRSLSNTNTLIRTNNDRVVRWNSKLRTDMERQMQIRRNTLIV